MIEVKGYAAQKAKADLAPWTFQRRSLGPNDVLVEIEYAGICHSDIHQVREEWGEALFPMVPGHEIAGRVKEVGTSVTKFKPGMKAGVGVFIDSCRKCENCLKGENQYCLEGMTGTYNGYERDGKTIAQGGYSTAIVVHEDYVLKLPDNLDMAGVAPLLCAGITLYSPLKHWGAAPGKKVGIIGLGGLGHMGVKFAVA
ncbi:MAG: alcohol dehydrogenase catalytic domain-containing protein, partial [Candidatus Nanopelagicales bacterium]